MFIFTYLPQVAVLAFVTGPLGEFWVLQTVECFQKLMETDCYICR
jgi:hypothetical protein